MYFFLKKEGFNYHLFNKSKEVLIHAKWVKKHQPSLKKDRLIPTLVVLNSDQSIFSSSYLQPNNSFIHFSWDEKYIVNIDGQKHVITCISFWKNIWEMHLDSSKFRYQSKFWDKQSIIHKDDTPILKIQNEIISLNQKELSLTDLQIGISIYLTIENPWQVNEIDL